MSSSKYLLLLFLIAAVVLTTIADDNWQFGRRPQPRIRHLLAAEEVEDSYKGKGKELHGHQLQDQFKPPGGGGGWNPPRGGGGWNPPRGGGGGERPPIYSSPRHKPPIRHLLAAEEVEDSYKGKGKELPSHYKPPHGHQLEEVKDFHKGKGHEEPHN